MDTNNRREPIVEIMLGESRVTVLGTAHVSQTSADAVRDLLATNQYDAVAVELCPSRYNAIVDPEALARMDLFEVLRSRKMPMVAASLALGAHQQLEAQETLLGDAHQGHRLVDAGHEALGQGAALVLHHRY